MDISEILALLTAVLWSAAVIFFKKSGERVHSVALNLFKDVLALVLFVPTALIAGQTLFFDAPRQDWVILAVSGVLGICIADTLFFYSLQLLGAGVSAVVNCLYSPAVILFSMAVLNERLTTLQIVGVCAIITAVGIATSGRSKETHSVQRVILGLAAGVGATVASAAGIVLMKPVLLRAPLIWVTEVRLIFGILALLLVLAVHPGRKAILQSLLIPGGRRFTFLGSIFGAYLGLLPWAAGFKYGMASTVSALQQTSYLLIFVMAVIFLKERMTIWRLGGIVLGMGGVYMVTFA